MRAIGEHIPLEAGQRLILMRVRRDDAADEMAPFDFSCVVVIDGDVATVKGLPECPAGVREALTAEIRRVGGYAVKWTRHRMGAAPGTVQVGL